MIISNKWSYHYHLYRHHHFFLSLWRRQWSTKRRLPFPFFQIGHFRLYIWFYFTLDSIYDSISTKLPYCTDHISSEFLLIRFGKWGEHQNIAVMAEKQKSSLFKRCDHLKSNKRRIFETWWRIHNEIDAKK